ncbi:MAG: hypothetical protein RR034_06110 [Bacteroidales bacterium]
MAAQKKAGDKIIADAQAEADKMLSATTNPIEKAAKKKAADLLIKEARKKVEKNNTETAIAAKKLVNDAQTEGNKLIEAAKNR